MPGKIIWLGTAVCNRCLEQYKGIPWGWGRHTLTNAGWQQINHRWYCPSCKKTGVPYGERSKQ